MYNRKAFKREAKQLMRASVPHFMLVALVYYLLTTGLSTAEGFLPGGGLLGGNVLSLFLTILISLFGIVMSVGFSNYALRLARGEETGMGSLFHGFSFSGRSIGLTLLVALFTFLWTMLVVIGFAAVVAVLTLALQTLPVVAAILAVVLYIAVIVVVVAIILRYAMAAFALVENPDAGVLEAIRRSVRMMRGHKGKLFVLELSFLGWDLLVGLIALVILAVGVVAGAAEGVFETVESLTLTEEGVWEAYNVFAGLWAKLTVWTLLAELISLPLRLWLGVYRQTAYARFFNFVSGYDYHRYMSGENASGQESPAVSSGAPEGPAEECAKPEEPVNGYYTSIIPPDSSAQEEPSEEEEN